MDLGREFLVALLLLSFCFPGSCNLVFEVQHKFKGRERSLSALKAHDVRRHGSRLLSVIDLQLGGNGHPAETGLYFARIGLGTPPKDYHVQVDTGSDILWVNCEGCSNCPKKSDIGVDLTPFDPKASSTSSLVTCDHPFCSATYDGPIPGCKPDLLCQYKVIYGDGSATSGFFVKDNIHLEQAVGNDKTAVTNGSVIFGCGAKQSGELGTSSEALDGIIGFGQANSSMISQLAAAGKVKKIFAHCLDSIKGGGIFAIGEVVEPKVHTTPVVPHQAHYNVMLRGVEVGGTALDISVGLFSDFRRGTIIDSGTTLAYLPEAVYLRLMKKILAAQPNLELRTVDDQFTCFQYSSNVDDGFPTVSFEFVDSLNLTVYPHEYLFQIREDMWCVGWQNSGAQSKDGKQVFLLGDMVLQNKLVYYNLENQTIGWTEYNCTSGIKLKDAKSQEVYTVGYHKLSSASNIVIARILPLLIAFTYFFIQ
ncbi:aspartic proteinase-like protein 2 [Momordica charantia]|uniref:Aspartic proteinase-like protein 2 n=1 Tax=Momordica charantia TaxID=3673 RepID=A0A6J1DVF4_MOMCH|nr:aspartic proteinase-like protein 2 [Momordica charantia]